MTQWYDTTMQIHNDMTQQYNDTIIWQQYNDTIIWHKYMTQLYNDTIISHNNAMTQLLDTLT